MLELISNQQTYKLLLPFANIYPKITLEAGGPYSADCQLAADNDLAAIDSWLQQYKTNKATFSAYQREAKRLFFWCIYERGVTLVQLKVDDFEEYFKFLKQPPHNWCTTRAILRYGKGNNWRPFLGPLKPVAYSAAVRIINSLINYLVEADYLRTNPIKLIKKQTSFNLDMEAHKYKVWTRMLETDEWTAVQDALSNMPEKTTNEIDNKMRTQFLFAVFYLLGLRISEVANSTWNAFRKHNGNWWFFIKGKGGKLGHIPVNEQLLAYVKAYRLYLGKLPLPDIDERENLIISKKTKRPLNIQQLYNLVKAVGNRAAESFPADSRKQERLRKLSPHWLRHLSASHQDKANIPATHIQANHRHSSSQTTQIYVHAEDEMRFQEMTKMQMQVQPRIIEPKVKPSTVELQLTLKGSAVCEALNLKKLLDVIENNILSDMTWKRVGDVSKDILAHQYQKARTFGKPLVLVYQLDDLKEGGLDFVKRGVVREAEIRLFSCEIKINHVSV